MKIGFTGATGQFGSIVAEALLKTVSADSLVASVRNPEKAESLRSRGVDVRHGDFDQPETLDQAFAGVDRLLLVSADGDNDTRIRQHKAAVDAAVRAGVGFIAYTSVGHAESSSCSWHRYTRPLNNSSVNPGFRMRSSATTGTWKMKPAPSRQPQPEHLG